MACSSQLNVVASLPGVEEHKSLLGSTVGVHDDQFPYKFHSLLEYVYNVLEESQVNDGVYRVDLNSEHNSLNFLCGEILDIIFVHSDHVYVNYMTNGIYLFEERLLGRNSLLLHIRLLLKKNALYNCGYDILVKGKSSLSLCP